ncbi:MAG: hypothetical protein JO057_26625 [Chloroflexi bacterium]|nr:hypothetical protein [Chloroflexota bacterium]
MALAGAALLTVALGGGVASAQTLPGLPSLDGNDQLQQVMLAGEANAVAQFLGISPAQLQSELAGKSLAQVAQQHGKSVSDLTDVVVDSADEQLDAAVGQGQIGSDAAAQYKNEIGFFAPFLVSSPEASAAALQAFGS